MKLFVILFSLLFAIPLFADGFICENREQKLEINAFNQTQPRLGTRNAAILVLSNPSVEYGNRTIATFAADTGLLTNQGSAYTAHVDLRYRTSNRRNAAVGPTRLGQLKFIVLDVAFSYARPVPAGTALSAVAILMKRSGEEIRLPMECTRYLKN